MIDTVLFDIGGTLITQTHSDARVLLYSAYVKLLLSEIGINITESDKRVRICRIPSHFTGKRIEMLVINIDTPCRETDAFLIAIMAEQLRELECISRYCFRILCMRGYGEMIRRSSDQPAERSLLTDHREFGNIKVYSIRLSGQIYIVAVP